MNRRRAIAAGIVAVVASRAAIGAPKATARVGYLELVKAADGERLYREFVEGLQSRGYVEGRNLQMLRRSASGQPERLRPLAVELAAAKVDVILAASIEAARSAKVAAPGVPTVFLFSGDPILEGLVTSLSRPQGDLTGLNTRGEELTGKRLQLLKEPFPGVRTVAQTFGSSRRTADALRPRDQPAGGGGIQDRAATRIPFARRPGDSMIGYRPPRHSA